MSFSFTRSSSILFSILRLFIPSFTLHQTPSPSVGFLDPILQFLSPRQSPVYVVLLPLYITLSPLSRSVVRNITLLPLLLLLTLPLRRLLLLLLLPLLLLLDSLAFSYLRHPLLDVHLHALGSIVYCSNSCSFAAIDFLLSLASPSPSSLYFQIIFFSGLQQCLRFYVELVYGLAGASALERGLLS